MKAFRVSVMGTNNSYLITEKQKPVIENVVVSRSERFIKIGDSLILTNSVKSIDEANVDLKSCPDYFQKQVEMERKNAPAGSKPFYRNLPKKTIIIDLEGNILTEHLGRLDLCRLTKERPTDKAILATCHYKVGEDGTRQYFTQFDQIAEARPIMFDPDYPHDPMTEGLYWYGVKQDVEKLLEQANSLAGNKRV